MKSSERRASRPQTATTQQQDPASSARRNDPFGRLNLSLLDEFSEQKARGYNPYDTRVAKSVGTNVGDFWRRKPKRD